VTGGYTSEIKFVVDASAGREIAQWVRERLVADEHGDGTHGDQYRVTSLYFDTAEGDVFHRRRSYGRSKYRIRRYGDEPTAYLERKLRTPALLAKRRTRIDAALLRSLADNTVGDGDPARWFERRLLLRRLRPVCQVSYLRLARHAATPAGIARLTLDAGLTAVATSTFAFVADADSGRTLLDNELILELKYRSHVPAAFKELVEAFRLNSRPASKYRLAAGALGVVGVHA
jgi:hypothetical protein